MVSLFVAITDDDWFSYLAAQPQLDEVNFWQPRGKAGFQAIKRGELFLFKLIKPLVEAGLLETVRGRKGGIRLGRPAGDITLLDAVKLTEENFALAECFEGSDVHCPLADSCDLSGALHEALRAFFDVLDGYTIADLADKRKSLRLRLGIEDLLPAAAH